MPIAWTSPGRSPYTKNAATNTSAGALALIGVAMDIGSVLSARKVNIQDVATIALLAAERSSSSPVTAPAAPSLPEAASPATNATQPKHVDDSNVGRTAFSLTLAFLARS